MARRTGSGNRINLRLPAESKAQLERRALAEGATISATVQRLLNGEASTRVDDSPFAVVPIDSVRPSGTISQEGRRGRFDADALRELAESIRSAGVVQPLAVRRGKNGVGHEIVAGERRWLAAKAAGLAEVPVVVGEWSDEAAVLVQLIENLQREGLHELDEARGYGQLRDQHGWDVRRLCQEVGRSRSYVYQRLRLLSLDPKCQAALEEGEINATIARVIATVPVPLQPQMLKSVRNAWNGVTTREAQRIVEQHYRRRLSHSGGGFDPADRSLIARFVVDGQPFEGAQDCLDCPANTSVEPSLGGAPDMCTQPDCFDGKRRQVTEDLVRTAEQRGKTVVRGETGDFEYGRPNPRRYLNEYEVSDVRAKARKAKVKVEEVLLVSEQDGKVHKVVRRKEARQKGLLDAPVRKVRKDSAAQKRIGKAAIVMDNGLPRLPEHMEPVTRAMTRLFVEHVRQRAGGTVLRRLATDWGSEMLEARDDGAWVAALDDGELMRFGAQLCAAMDFDRAEWSPQAADLLVAAADAVSEAYPDLV